MRAIIVGFLLGAAACVAAAYFFLGRGYIDFGADATPSRIEANFAMSAVDEWADRRAGDRSNPVAATEENVVSGATIYLNHCAGCHGVPSNPESQFQRSFYPPAPGFFREKPDMGDSETFYVIKRGIRWTGMPTWGSTLTDEQIWQSVLFLDNAQKLPTAAEKIFESAAASPPTK